VTDAGWAEVVASSRQIVGDDPAEVRQWSVTHARALAAGAALYRDQRERGSSADRDDLVAAAAAAADQVLSAAAAPGAGNGIDPEVVGELGDRSLDGLAVLARGSLGELAVESLLAAGSLPRPRGAATSSLDLGPDGWQLAFTMEDGEDLAELTTLLDIVPLERGLSGRITAIALDYRSHDRTRHRRLILDQHAIRDALSETFLFSSAFFPRIERYDDGVPIHIVLVGAGWGHGAALAEERDRTSATRGTDRCQDQPCDDAVRPGPQTGCPG